MNRRRLVAVIGGWALTIRAAAAQRTAGFSTAETARVDQLLKLIQKRLEQSPATAEARWKAMARIEDSASEQAAIDAVRTAAESMRLDPEFAIRFAQAQIDAGKIIQTARHREWAANSTIAPPRQGTAGVFHASTPEPAFSRALLRALRDSLAVLRRRGSRGLLDARAADLIHVGGPDLLAGQAALKPLYEIAN